MKNKTLTYKEERILAFMEGNRRARLIVDRRILIRAMKIHGEEQGYTPSKETIRKINREIEHSLLQTLMFIVLGNKLTVEYVDKNFDRLFLLPNDTGADEHERTIDELPLKSETQGVPYEK